MIFGQITEILKIKEICSLEYMFADITKTAYLFNHKRLEDFSTDGKWVTITFKRKEISVTKELITDNQSEGNELCRRCSPPEKFLKIAE